MIGTDKAFKHAIAHLNSGRLLDAEVALKDLLRKNPKNFDAAFLLGLCCVQVNNVPGAVKYFSKSVDLRPSSVDALFNLAVSLTMSERHEDALTYYDRVIALEPRHVHALSNRAATLQVLGRPDDALSDYECVVSIDPNNEQVHNNRGIVLYDLGHYARAVECFDAALIANPKNALTICNRARALYALARHQEALSDYETALQLKADLPKGWLGYGNVLGQTRRFDEALAAYDRALALAPDLAGAWLGRGNVFCEVRRFDQAQAAYSRALELDPDMPEALLGRGNALFHLNKDREALDCYDCAIKNNGRFAQAYYNKGLVKLSLGEFSEGWPLYEWRFKANEVTDADRGFRQARWLGGDIGPDRTLFVHSEYGLGDTIQFSRCVFLVKTRCRVLFEVQRPLVPLFDGCDDRVTVIARGDEIPIFDAHCPLMSLPFALGTTLETIPADIPYIVANPDKKAIAKALLGARTKPRIGLAWSGNSRNREDVDRSIPLETLLPILDEAFEFHSLQKDVRDADRATLANARVISEYRPLLDDFPGTAALISEMDLIVSIDSALAHLAGAIGRPVWVLLPYHADFRWLRDRTDSPWYPTAHLFRQRAKGDWRQVVGEVKAELHTTPLLV